MENNPNDATDGIIELLNEDNQPEKFEFLMPLEHGGKTYLALIPAEMVNEQEPALVFMAVEGEEDNEVYEVVTDEALAETLLQEVLLLSDEDGE